jgi:hypothetical protein
VNQHTENIGVAVIYLNHKDVAKQTPQNLLASLWQQLIVSRRKAISFTACRLYEKHHEIRTRPTAEEIYYELSSTIAECSKVFILVDALDEYPQNQRGIFLRSLARLGSTVNLMLTSRPHIDIATTFPNVDILEISASESDIRQYVDVQIAQVASLEKMIKDHPDVRNDIETSVVSGSEGMCVIYCQNIMVIDGF